MQAIYRGELFRLEDDLNVAVLLHPDTFERVHVVDFGDPDLVVDPTYGEVVEAEQRSMEQEAHRGMQT